MDSGETLVDILRAGDRKALWSWTSRAVLVKCFEIHERLSDTGSASQSNGNAGLTRSSFMRFVRGLNSASNLDIDAEVASLILTKVCSIQTRESIHSSL